MSDEPKKRRSWPRIGWALVALLLAYPLSIGPVVWFHAALGLPHNRFYPGLYRPVFWLAFQSETSNTVLYEYINLYSTIRWGHRDHRLGMAPR